MRKYFLKLIYIILFPTGSDIICGSHFSKTITTMHSFHIPVMGLAFTIDTPLKVAKFGIDSVVSIIQDNLMEKMREYYCKEHSLFFDPIPPSLPDYRAKRIKKYLNLLKDIVDKQIKEIKSMSFTSSSDLTKYFEMQPATSALKESYNTMLKINIPGIKSELQAKLKEAIVPGSIDVNIMTKLDRTNYSPKGEALPEEYSDALAALRGYAESNLSSSLVFSAGLNPRLYSYTENFEDFYPNERGEIKKKIIIKVSDYRSALIQGKFLAKKGLWVSEFRVESGLNCGGHAFATDGYLLGPILDEFKRNRTKLIDELHGVYKKGLAAKNKPTFEDPLPMKFSVQGGVGTSSEHNFLLNHYSFDSVGWGTPFLLVPEATQVDEETLEKLAKAGKEDLYLSHSSPLGVPFNTLRTSSARQQKLIRVKEGKPGSPCKWKYLSFNTEFTDKPICTASRKYQAYKLDALKQSLSSVDYEIEKEKVIEKECLCDGLANSALINSQIAKKETPVSVCPGPNLAYFSRISTLREMVGHIYGEVNLLNTTERPNMFVNELGLYFDYLKNELKNVSQATTEKQLKSLALFKSNLLQGIDYYKDLVHFMKEETEQSIIKFLEQLRDYEMKINSLEIPEVLCVQQ